MDTSIPQVERGLPARQLDAKAFRMNLGISDNERFHMNHLHVTWY